MSEDPRLLSCSEVGRLYRISRHTVAAKAKSRELPSVRRGKTLWVSAKYAEVLWGAK